MFGRLVEKLNKQMDVVTDGFVGRTGLFTMTSASTGDFVEGRWCRSSFLTLAGTHMSVYAGGCALSPKV